MLTTLCIFVFCVSVQSSFGIVDDPVKISTLSKYDQDGIPFGDNDNVATAPAVRDQDCDKAASLENIFEIMISMLRKDVSENVKTALILKALTDLLKNTTAYNDKVMYKINDLIRTLDKYEDRKGDEDKPFLRTGPEKEKTAPVKTMVRQRKRNGKIRLKYELPGLKNPHCTEALLNIIKVVYQAYVSLAKSPICKSTLVSPTFPSIHDTNNIVPYILKPESIQNPHYHLNPNEHHSKPHSEENSSSPPGMYQPFTESIFPNHRISIEPNGETYSDDKFISNIHPFQYHYPSHPHLHPYPHPQHHLYHHQQQHPHIFGHQPHSKIPYSWNNGFPYDKDSESSPLNPYYPEENTPQNDRLPQAPWGHPENYLEDVSEIPLIPKIPPYTYDINTQNNDAPEPWPFSNLQKNPEGSSTPFETIPTRPYPFEIKPLTSQKINLSPFVNLQNNPEESFKFPLESEPEGYPNKMIPDTHNYFPADDIYSTPNKHRLQIIPHTKDQGHLAEIPLEKPLVAFETIPDNLINYLYPHKQHSNKYHDIKPGKPKPEYVPFWSDGTKEAEPQTLKLPHYNHVTSQPDSDLPNGETPKFIPIQSFVKESHGPDTTSNPNSPFGPNQPYGPSRPYLANPDVFNPNNYDNLYNPEDDGTLEPNELSPNEPYLQIPSDENPTADIEFDTDQLHLNRHPFHPIVNNHPLYEFIHPYQTPKSVEHPNIHYKYPYHFKPDYPDEETKEPIYDWTHSDQTQKHPPTTPTPLHWHPIGSETLIPSYPAPYVPDPTPPETELASSVKVIGFIRDAIEVIEGLIPAVKFNSPTLVIIAKIKKILVQKDTDINDDEFATIIKLYKKLINYVKQLNEYREIIDIIDLPRVTNHSKLKTEKVVELTYLVKRPQPVIYYPYYYVKYKLPYTSLVFVQKLLKKKPHLRMNPHQLYKELLADSNVDETSPDINNLQKNDLLKLTVDTGSLVDAKIVGGNEELNKQLNVLREITSEFTSEALLELIRNVTNNTTFTTSKLETENSYQANDVSNAQNSVTSKEKKHNDIKDVHLEDIREDDKSKEQTSSLSPESLRDRSPNPYENLPGGYTTEDTDLEFTSFDSDKLRSDVLRGENVGLPYSDYVLSTVVSPLDGMNDPIAKPSQGPLAPAMHKLIDATLKARNSRLREANQQNFLNNGGLVSSDSDQISLNTGTGNSQTGVTIISPKIMINQASVKHAVTNSDITETKYESNNQQNTVNTALTQGNHQEFNKQNNMWYQQNYLNLGGLVNLNHQNISLNAGEGNWQDNVSYISPEVMLNDMKPEDDIDHTRTSKAPIDSQYANFKPDTVNQLQLTGDINVTSPLGYPIDFKSLESPNKYGQSSIGVGNPEGHIPIKNNPENIQKPNSMANEPNAGSKYPESGSTNTQEELTNLIKDSIKDDISLYADSGAGKEKQTINSQNTENPNDQHIFNKPITTNTGFDQHESYTGTIFPQSTPGIYNEMSNAANQGIYDTGMGQSSAVNHNSGDFNWGSAAYQQNLQNYYPGVSTNQQSLGYDLGVQSQQLQNVKGYNMGALTKQQNLGYNFGALASQSGYNLGLTNHQNLGGVSNHQILGGYNAAHRYNMGGYSSGTGRGLGFQASQQNIANFGPGGLSGHQVNYVFQSMPLYYKRPIVTLMTPTYTRPGPFTVVG